MATGSREFCLVPTRGRATLREKPTRRAATTTMTQWVKTGNEGGAGLSDDFVHTFICNQHEEASDV
jgi:hypothetical protein